MKKIIVFLTVVALGLFSVVNAQNSEGKADDGARISITPQVNDLEIPEGAKRMLLTKMKQICTKNGLAGDGNNPFFVMDAAVDVLSKEIMPTAPPMHALNLSVSFFIKDAMNGNVYSEANIEVKGVGKNETKAYTMGLKNIKATQGVFKAMVERGKTKIIEFYNSDCDFIVSKAQALHKQGNSEEAIKVLKTVPMVSKECYAKCMELLSEIEPPVEAVPAAATSTESTAGPAETTTTDVVEEIADADAIVAKAVLAANSKVFIEIENEDRFMYKGYSPGKIKTLASAATKDEYEVMAMGDCNSDVKWTKDIITQWHQATKENVKEGMLVLYTAYGKDISSTVCFNIGKIVAVDELYKNLVTIKGDWDNIRKVDFNQVLIVDKSNIAQ